MNGGHPVYWPGYRIVHLPECADGCTMLRRPLLSREGEERNRALRATWAHDMACLCGPCVRARGGQP